SNDNLPKTSENLTTDWQGRKSRVCTYPIHEGPRKQIQLPRRVNASMSLEIHQLLNAVVPIGSEDYPSIKKAYVRSDNAGCYHNGALLLSLPYIAKRTGILPMRYDFSDPQAGKDICDRKIAPMKAHMRRYVNEKHDIKTAQDMKQALESHGGIKGCRTAIAKKMALGRGEAITSGPDGLFKYEELQVRPQQETGLEVLQQFGPRTRELGTIAGNAQDPSSKNDIYSCSETDCVLTFKTSSEAEAHMD
ncbi:hypothetical protein QZH41_020610, partial [Actinostola sp. cb2023]